MASKSDPKTYTKPELRDKIKEQVVKGNKGGNPGQWSARKAQLVAQEYEKQGGDYKKPRNPAQKSLKKWGDEAWTTADGKPAKRDGEMNRYLPEKAWEQLSPAQKRATNKKKIEGSKKGQQFVSNTGPASQARKKAVSKKAEADAEHTRSGPVKKAVARKSTANKPAAKKLGSRKAVR